LYINDAIIHMYTHCLSRCVSLSRLRSVETVELLSTVIEHLVKGEVRGCDSVILAVIRWGALVRVYHCKPYQL
jgi:hypothetical protein